MKKHLKDITVSLLIAFILVSIVLQFLFCLSGCNMNMTGFILTALAFYVIGVAVGRNWDEFTKE